ncbi:protein lin-37 homolog [Eurosta solidaginis]|uniref:protein lin-37 homolog n=1 Tax=Eurosta solidaginis TaxID=178769 RepID=UPI003530D0F9
MKTPPHRRRGQNDDQQARGNCRNILNEPLPYSEDDGNATEEDLPHRGRPPKNLNSLQRDTLSPRSSPHSSLSPKKYLTPTNRRRRDDQSSVASGEENNQVATVQPTQKIQAESFVMKLFDRSLDLSKYTEQTALYPICRAWMSNQPRNSNIRSYRDRRSPSPFRRNNNATDMIEKLKRGELREVKSMPAPKSLDITKIPIIERDEVYSTKDIDAEVFRSDELQINTSKDELLGSHLNKWRAIKSSWIKQNKMYQKRYELNHLILQELFKP